MLVDKLVRFVHVIFFSIISWIVIIALWTSAKKYSFFALLGFVLFVLAFMWMKKRVGKWFYKIPEKNLMSLFLVICAVMFGIMVVISWSLRVDIYDTWDYGQLIRTAYETAVNGRFDNAEYYARYPNNSLFLLLLSAYFRCIKPLAGENIYNYLNATIPMNCVLVVLSVLFCYLTARMLFSERKAFLCGMISVGILPLYMYAAIAYTDVFAIFPVSALLFFYTKAKQQETVWKATLWLAFTAIVTAVGYKVKATLVILFLAVIVDLVFHIWKKKLKIRYLIIYLSIFFVVLAGCAKVSDAFLLRNGVTEEMQEKEAFPITHWLMMSLNPNYEGGYNQEDVDYTKSFSGKSEKSDADMKKIKERVNELGVTGVIDHLLVKKVARMWGAGDYSACDYVSRQPLSEHVMRNFFALNGSYNLYCRIWCQFYHLVIIGFIWLTGRRFVKGHKLDKRFVAEVAFIGIFLFFVLWECNARYLFVFLPVFVLLSMKEEKEKEKEDETCTIYCNTVL